MKRFFAMAALVALSLSALAAWDNHAQLAYLALKSEPYASEKVQAESLDSFIAAESGGLAALLADVEKASIRDIPEYRPTPAALAFTGKEAPADLRLAFIHAIRVNPKVPFALYAQLEAGAARDGRPDLPVTAADIYDNHLPNGPFKALSEGEAVSSLEVLASASDEPDYGMDIGLFSDNKSEVSGLYGFGPQAFGNPALPYGSQAPFHMSFAAEAPIIKAAASFTRISLSDWRFRLYTELSRFAFAEGHTYWGYRFAGWSLHYLGDMGQPYHASCIPGKTTLGILWLYATGSQAKKDGEMILLSNRHLVLEDYLYGAMAAYKGDDSASPLYAALEGAAVTGAAKASAAVPPYRKGYLYDVVARRAYNRGHEIDRLIVADFPAAWTLDPKFDFGTVANHDAYGDLKARAPEKAAAFEAACVPLFADVGAEARAYMAYIHEAEK